MSNHTAAPDPATGSAGSVRSFIEAAGFGSDTFSPQDFVNQQLRANGGDTGARKEVRLCTVVDSRA